MRHGVHGGAPWPVAHRPGRRLSLAAAAGAPPLLPGAPLRPPGRRPTQAAEKLPGVEVPRGAVAVPAGRVDGSTRVLPFGPAWTAIWVALPARYWDQDQNHWVHPSSHLPAFGLATIVIGLPGTDRL